MGIGIRVVNQQLRTTTNFRTLVSGSQNFVRFIFDLSNEWDDLLVFAQFTQNGVGYNMYLDEENSVYLPSEIVDGTFTLMLYGSGGFNSGVVATTNSLTFNVIKSNYIEDGSEVIIENSIATVDEVENYVTTNTQ